MVKGKDHYTTESLIEKALKRMEDKYEERQQDLFTSQIVQEPKAAFSQPGSKTGPGQNEEKGQINAKQLDLFKYQAAQLQRIEAPKLRTKQEVSTTPIQGMDISETGFVIQSPQDAATLLSHLVASPQENVYNVYFVSSTNYR